MKRPIAVTLVVLALPLALSAAEKSISLPPDNPYAELKPGPGAEITRVQCASCHSTDYVVMQPRGDAKQWEAVARKMINVYGAKLSEAEVKAIVEYLASAYGPAK
jgi:mono/diheme cytochrome c family protein